MNLQFLTRTGAGFGANGLAVAFALLVGGECSAAEPPENEARVASGRSPLRITRWEDGAKLAWIDAVQVEGVGPVLLLDASRQDEGDDDVALDLRDGTTVIMLYQGLPQGVENETYARLAVENASRIAAVRQRLAGSEAVAAYAALSGNTPIVGETGNAIGVLYVVLHVNPAKSENAVDDVLVDPQIVFSASVGKETKRFIYYHRAFGDGAETAERWAFAEPPGEAGVAAERWTQKRGLGEGGRFSF